MHLYIDFLETYSTTLYVYSLLLMTFLILFFSLAYLKNIVCNTYNIQITVNQLFVMGSLLINSRLLVVIFWGSQYYMQILNCMEFQ